MAQQSKLTLKLASFIGLAFCLFFPSLGIVQKYVGLPGAAVYLLLALGILILVRQPAIERFYLRLSERRVIWLAAVTFGGLVFLFELLYPLANSGMYGGGSDRDEALNLATRALLRGAYPYTERTYLGNPISPMPGALILAVPFVWLGNSAYQNIFWLLIGLVTVIDLLKDSRRALVLLWLTLGLSPIVLHEMVTGGDLLANSLYVLVFSLACLRAVQAPGLPGWRKILPAIVLGIGLSSRPHFWLICPLLLVAMAQQAGWKTALRLGAIAGLTFLVVTLPFYLPAPQAFTPLHAWGKLAQFEMQVPYAAWLVVLVSAGAVLLAVWRTQFTTAAWLQRSAWVISIPILCAVGLQCVTSGTLTFAYAGFGLSFLFFGALGFWLS